jgi:hypothetical protein
MKIGISGFVLIMVYMLYKNWRLPKLSGFPFLVGFGAAAGLIQGSAGVGGPPAVVIALSRSGTIETQRANVIGAVTALNLSNLLPLWYYGLFTYEVLIISLLMFPLYLGSTWLGTRFFSQLGRDYFRNGALLILAAIGASTLLIACLSYAENT